MKKFKIFAEFVKDISGETKDVQTYLFVKDYISKYQLTIDIISKPIKFKDKEPREKKSYFEIVYASIIKIDEDIKDKKDLQKIILCDLQKEIQPNLEKTFTNLLNNSGFNEVNINKIDFDKLYNERFN